MNLIGIGDDYYQDRDEYFPGGNALNVAVLARRYGGGRAGYIGIVGNDHAAAHVLESLRLEGVETTRVRQAVGPNGMAVVSLDAGGDRIFVRSNKGGVQSGLKLHLGPQDLEYLRGFDLIHTSVYSHLEAELPQLHALGRLSFDFSTRRDPGYLAQVCPHLDFAFFSGSGLGDLEVAGLIDEVHRLGCPTVGVTRGGEGAIFSHRGELYRQGVKPTRVVDTLGAGDSFIAGFLVAFGGGRPLPEALDYAADCAAKTCEYYGAFGYPHPHREAQEAAPGAR
ncbi:fructoselysine 6-kinase [Deinobacterium chartae]|uniref:Fructoselysine 6-kinase n=1 Tax=Deinobacterium chartae TaxID=521158 RepID=A0A841I2U0_9DEIO|nr:PfkB family carbohydrate kinase [Deinobacterium chartae]MBB6098362.1 fructoselysine 6-kinase [Deinobacterium chartae]